ncbi:MAG: 2-isopropylmalate synthase, partial [Verrucomicrobiae bacterium]|nr:2-isopropylmalate synthase [Verrucomicrobiae bacterium]
SPLELIDYELDHHGGARGEVACHAKIAIDGEERAISGVGNGPINAFVHAMENGGLKDCSVSDYRSHAVRGGSDADSAAYILLQRSDDNRLVWGCGVDPSIEMAGLKALVSAWNLAR